MGIPVHQATPPASTQTRGLTTQINSNVTNSDNPNSRQVNTNAGEAAARRNQVYQEAQRTAQEQPASWGREARSNSQQQTSANSMISDEKCSSSLFCSVFGKTAFLAVFSQNSTPAPVENRTPASVTTTSNNSQSDQNKINAATLIVNNPNNAADVAHFIGTGYSGNSNQNSGSQANGVDANYSHEGNRAGEPAMHTEPMSPPVTLPTVTVTAPREQQPFKASDFQAPVQLPVANLMPNLSGQVDQNYGHEQNHTVQAPTQDTTNTSAFNNGQGEGSGVDRHTITTGIIQRLQEQAASNDSPVSGDNSTNGCFVAGTKIVMSDLSLKNIEEIKIGDSVMSSEGPSTVSKLMRFDHDGDIYAYNGSGNYFFTPNHPFMTTKGWRSFRPTVSMEETPSITVSTTTVGDVLQRYGSQEKIYSYQKKTMKGIVYNFTVTGAHTYYANGYLVHNLKTENTGNFGGYEDLDW